MSNPHKKTDKDITPKAVIYVNQTPFLQNLPESIILANYTRQLHRCPKAFKLTVLYR